LDRLNLSGAEGVELVSHRVNFDFEYQNLPPKGSGKKNRFVPRKIVSGRIDPKLPKNGISTGKYNVFTFIPKNLMEQFSKIANIYFLVIGIMQSIDVISVSNGNPDIFAPLFLIILISAFKDLFEDIKRHRSDREENTKFCHVLDPKTGALTKRTWQSLCVGEIIKIEKNEYIPADILLLRTSDTKGEAFIETKNLDGETNLKHKTVPKLILKAFISSKEEFNYQEKIIFDYEAPNPYLYTFNGSVTTKNDEKVPLDANNFILRGCSVRNTNWIYGLVAYSGHDTKIMLNSVKARPKKSKVERMMSFQIIIVFIFQGLLCLFCAIYYAVWLEDNDYLETSSSYLDFPTGDDGTNVGYNIGTRFGNWMIIFSNFVPISLLVTLEMVKFIQGILINKDPEMVHKASNTPTTVQTSNLNEELGQIEYIFSDKTGTLTQNYMEFRKLIARGKPFGLDRSMTDISKFPDVTNVNFRDQTFMNALQKGDAAISDYLMALAVCHTIITENKDGEIIYNASSPDELALVNFAKFVGCEYIGMDDEGRMTISFKNKQHKFKLLQVLEFNSKRKRMSVIVEDEKGQIVLYCKGADSILLELMNKDKNPDIDVTLQHLMEFADEGLRTLLICNRIIPKNEYETWAKRYLNACIATENRLEKMEELQAEIEQDLSLIGATAIEDKLQDEVGSTIAFLKKAGIKVWVLTGDKIETAINIGFACNLLTKELERLIIDGKSYEDVETSIKEANQTIDLCKSVKGVEKFALIVSGDALIQAMKDPLSAKLMDIANICDAVLCCRVAPKQKAEVVTLVRKTKPNVSTLAIGDGANDVNMITAAHVGIGIRGVEGQQASRASDYAIGEFKLLKRLLVHHGRECYRKNCNLILYNFFKNIILVLSVFWIGFNMVFSGQRVYESWLYSLFNVFYASLPIVLYAIFDKQYADNSLTEYPFLYQPGIDGRHFNTMRFWMWFGNGVFQSVLIGLIGMYILEDNFVTDKGRVLDLWSSGALILGLCVAVSNLKVLTFSHSHSFITLFVIFGSIVVYILSFVVVNYLSTSDLYYIFQDLFSVPTFYFGNFIIVIATSFMDLSIEKYFAVVEHKMTKRMKRAYNTKKVAQSAESAQPAQEVSPPLAGKNSPKLDLETQPRFDTIREGTPARRPLSGASVPGDRAGTPATPRRFQHAHTGYCFSENENYNHFNLSKGIAHPQN